MENVKYIQNFLTTKLYFVKCNFFISSKNNIEFFKAYKLQKLEQFETLFGALISAVELNQAQSTLKWGCLWQGSNPLWQLNLQIFPNFAIRKFIQTLQHHMGSWLKTLCYKFIKNVIIVTPPKQLKGPSDWLKTCFYLFKKQKQKLKPKQLTGPSDWVRSLLYLFAAEIPVALFLSMAAGAEYKSKCKFKFDCKCKYRNVKINMNVNVNLSVNINM